MSTDTPLIRYHVVRALEHAAFTVGAAPTRVDRLLLPAHRVEIRATVTDAKPYALIDQHLERGIAEGRLGSVAELADFFALDEHLVGRAVRFLVAVGHITDVAGRLTLTDLGYRSIRDGVRYEVTRQDRRQLYFDAFDSRPFTQRYYDSRRVTFVSAGDPRTEWFKPLASLRGFRAEALTELAANPDRARYNLPVGVEDLEYLSADSVFLPAYVIRAVQRGNVRYLAYTQVGETDDAEVTELCERNSAITGTLENEYASDANGLNSESLRRWLSRRGLTGHEPERSADGTWLLALPASAFGRPELPIHQVGSFAVFGSGVVHLWTKDETTRHRALLERVDSILGSRTRVDGDEFRDHLAQLTRQLDLGAIDVPMLRHLASNAGRKSLAAQLEKLC